MFVYIHTLQCFFFFFFNDTATTEIYTLSLHDALPIYGAEKIQRMEDSDSVGWRTRGDSGKHFGANPHRSEEHTSELQSQSNLVCRLLLEKKKRLPYTDISGTNVADKNSERARRAYRAT